MYNKYIGSNIFVVIYVYVFLVYIFNIIYIVIVKFDLFLNDLEFFKGFVDYEIKISVLIVYVLIFFVRWICFLICYLVIFERIF